MIRRGRVVKAIIFDLDQTLINSQHLEPLRRARKWTLVYNKISSISAYDGISDVLSLIKDKDIKLAIVSSAPLSYVKRVVRYFGWSFDEMVGYHDTREHKPHPAPFIEVAKRLRVSPKYCWAVGDDPKDIIAAKRAGMYAIGALWGSLDKESLKKANPDALFENVSDLYEAIRKI